MDTKHSRTDHGKQGKEQTKTSSSTVSSVQSLVGTASDLWQSARSASIIVTDPDDELFAQFPGLKIQSSKPPMPQTATDQKTQPVQKHAIPSSGAAQTSVAPRARHQKVLTPSSSNQKRHVFTFEPQHVSSQPIQIPGLATGSATPTPTSIAGTPTDEGKTAGSISIHPQIVTIPRANSPDSLEINCSRSTRLPSVGSPSPSQNDYAPPGSVPASIPHQLLRRTASLGVETNREVLNSPPVRRGWWNSRAGPDTPRPLSKARATALAGLLPPLSGSPADSAAASGVPSITETLIVENDGYKVMMERRELGDSFENENVGSAAAATATATPASNSISTGESLAVSPLEKTEKGETVHSIHFNANASRFALTTAGGFVVMESSSFKPIFSRQFGGGDLGICEMVDDTNIFCLVGGGLDPRRGPNQIIIWNDHEAKDIGKVSLREQVRAVRVGRRR
jgi:hypothetical protein